MANYNARKVRVRRSYSIEDMAHLFNITRKTAERWIKNRGLKVIEKNVNPLVMGIDLKSFIKDKFKKGKIILKENECFCINCKKGVIPKIGSEKIISTGKRIGKINKEQFMKKGICPFCGTKLNKFMRVY